MHVQLCFLFNPQLHDAIEVLNHLGRAPAVLSRLHFLILAILLRGEAQESLESKQRD